MSCRTSFQTDTLEPLVKRRSRIVERMPATSGIPHHGQLLVIDLTEPVPPDDVCHFQPKYAVDFWLAPAERRHCIFHHGAHRVEITAELPHAPCGERRLARARARAWYA